MAISRGLKLFLACLHRAVFLIIYILLGALAYKHIKSDEKRWLTYEDSIHYAITSISTIGYGFIYPITSECKAFNSFYCLFGIPLYFYTLTAWGRLINHLIRWLIGFTERLLCNHNHPAFLNCKTFCCLIVMFIVQLCIYAGIDTLISPTYDGYRGHYVFAECMHGWLMSLLSVGYGDHKPFEMKYTAWFIIFILFGMATVVAMVLVIADANEAKQGKPASKIEKLMGIYDHGDEVPANAEVQQPLTKSAV